MQTYLDETRFAARALIETYMADFRELNRTIQDYNTGKNALKGHRTNVVGKAGAANARSLIDAFSRVQALGSKIQISSRQLAGRRAATAALCGALLQIAKQGISIVHGGFPTRAIGPMQGSQPLENVIWQARNQAMHWEERHLNRTVRACFTALDRDHAGALSPDILSRSMATAIVDILHWYELATYERDMMSLS